MQVPFDPSARGCAAFDAVVRSHVSRGVRALAEAFARAEASGERELAGYVAVTSDWDGLAFARALVGERAVRMRADGSEPVAGCAATEVVARALAAIGRRDAVESLLASPPKRDVYPVVVVWRSCRIVAIGKKELIARAYASCA